MMMQRRNSNVALSALLLVLSIGCSREAETQPIVGDDQRPSAIPLEASIANLPGEDGAVVEPRLVRWASIPQLPKDVAIMDTVFWEPEDTTSLRLRIFSDPILRDAEVLEIGTGSGLISLCCLQAGAARMVATDLNPAAVENARWNASEMGFSDRFEARLVPRRSPGAWTVIEPDAKYDLIISNPPWEDSKPVTVEQFALYDPSFELLQSLVTGARQRLKPSGKMWLAYGCVTAIRKIQEVAAAEKLRCDLLDDRELSELPELFLPGMLIEISVL